MMVSVPQLRGLQVQHCTVSLPRIDALLDDPDTRYFVPVEARAPPICGTETIIVAGEPDMSTLPAGCMSGGRIIA